MVPKSKLALEPLRAVQDGGAVEAGGGAAESGAAEPFTSKLVSALRLLGAKFGATRPCWKRGEAANMVAGAVRRAVPKAKARRGAVNK